MPLVRAVGVQAGEGAGEPEDSERADELDRDDAAQQPVVAGEPWDRTAAVERAERDEPGGDRDLHDEGGAVVRVGEHRAHLADAPRLADGSYRTGEHHREDRPPSDAGEALRLDHGGGLAAAGRSVCPRSYEQEQWQQPADPDAHGEHVDGLRELRRPGGLERGRVSARGASEDRRRSSDPRRDQGKRAPSTGSRRARRPW